jgi:hypothetical protein
LHQEGLTYAAIASMLGVGEGYVTAEPMAFVARVDDYDAERTLPCSAPHLNVDFAYVVTEGA